MAEAPIPALSYLAPGTEDVAVNEELASFAADPTHFVALCSESAQRAWDEKLGVMFTADHERAAAELVRVTRPGGRIGLANWTPTGFIGQLLKTVADGRLVHTS